MKDLQIEIVRELRRNGFVNITGLSRQDGTGVVLPSVDGMSAWDENNGYTVVFYGYTVWLRAGYKHDAIPTMIRPAKGAWVPCSNGDHVGMRDLLARVSDPFWNGSPAVRQSGTFQINAGYTMCPSGIEELVRHPAWNEYVARVKSEEPAKYREYQRKMRDLGLLVAS